MFEILNVKCERYFKNLKKRKGILFFINRNRKLGWYGNGDSKKDGEYIGKIENRKPNGQGAYNYSNGERYIGEWKGLIIPRSLNSETIQLESQHS